MMLYAMIRASGSVEVVLTVLVIIRQIRVISGQKKTVAGKPANLFPRFPCDKNL